jgi:hypothetical protein
MLCAILRNAGLRPSRLKEALRGWPRYVAHRNRFRNLTEGNEFAWGKELPILNEWGDPSGGIGAYFLQDLTVARWIRERQPARHVDIGSRLDGFIGHLAVFREVEVIDIRPAPGEVEGVTFHRLDVMRELPERWLGCTDSLSCLHTIEHFGLGRYGDPIDPTGHAKGLERLKSMVAAGGRLYLSTPIGPQRIEFNAHRIFSAATVLGWFSEGWEIERFAVIDDANRLHTSMDWKGSGTASNFGCTTGVGIVVARKT